MFLVAVLVGQGLETDGIDFKVVIVDVVRRESFILIEVIFDKIKSFDVLDALDESNCMLDLGSVDGLDSGAVASWVSERKCRLILGTRVIYLSGIILRPQKGGHVLQHSW